MRKRDKARRMYMLRAQCFAPFYGIAYTKGAMVERLKEIQKKYPDTELRVVRVTVSEERSHER